jgi:diguanylate cyclase (GGDEF)-like protein
MVARILLINENKSDLFRISNDLRSFYCALLFSKSIDDALRIVGSQSIDLALLSIAPTQSKLFFDFFSVLRQSCYSIPIVGLIDKESPDIYPFFEAGIDDIIYSDISSADLIRKVNSSVMMKNIFDENLLSHVRLDQSVRKNIVSVFHENIDFLHPDIVKDTEITVLKTWPTAINMDNADLFIIDMNHQQAEECCANLHLRKTNKRKPIVFTFDEKSKSKAERAMDLGIGCSDIVDITSDSIIIATRLNSLIKHKKLYETLSQKIKKSLYLSAIDSTTEVYNRSFFEDYLKSKENNCANFAILMIDVDKFKFINDKFGHSFADSVLRHVSGMIKRYIRSSDIVARYGGDEFVIIMRDVSKAIAVEIANRIQKKIEKIPFNGAKCTVSIGICCINSTEDIPMQDAILIADKFMYMAKQSGGNSVKICA